MLGITYMDTVFEMHIQGLGERNVEVVCITRFYVLPIVAMVPNTNSLE